jgi:hypothetical protein
MSLRTSSLNCSRATVQTHRFGAFAAHSGRNSWTAFGRDYTSSRFTACC